LAERTFVFLFENLGEVSSYHGIKAQASHIRFPIIPKNKDGLNRLGFIAFDLFELGKSHLN
jgi:hypothetical protein